MAEITRYGAVMVYWVSPDGQVAQVVERGPEKAGVGGSTPSLATIFSIAYEGATPEFVPFCSNSTNPGSRIFSHRNEMNCLTARKIGSQYAVF